MTLAEQLEMNRQTWEVLRTNGVTEESEIASISSTTRAAEEQARALAAFIEAETDYDVRVESQGGGLLKRKRWAVAGTTQTTSISLEILDQWVEWMVAAGLENGGCEFDGWGTELP